MGQISLPRLEKINTHMFWESNIFVQEERWLNPKLFIFQKLLAIYLLQFSKSGFKKIFKKQPYSYGVKVIYIKFLKQKIGIMHSKNYSVLGRYNFLFNGNYVTLILYSCFNTRKQLLQLTSHM